MIQEILNSLFTHQSGTSELGESRNSRSTSLLPARVRGQKMLFPFKGLYQCNLSLYLRKTTLEMQLPSFENGLRPRNHLTTVDALRTLLTCVNTEVRNHDLTLPPCFCIIPASLRSIARVNTFLTRFKIGDAAGASG